MAGRQRGPRRAPAERVRAELLARFRAEQIEPPTPGRLLRMVRSALRAVEQDWTLRISMRLDPLVRSRWWA